MKPFNKTKFFSTLWFELTKRNIDPRTLTVEHYFDPKEGEIVQGSLHKTKRSADYFAFKINPLEATQDIDYWDLAAKRAAFAIEARRFPNKIDWAVAFEKRLDEILEEEVQKNDKKKLDKTKKPS